MDKLFYTPAIMVNRQVEYFLDKEKYETVEIPNRIQKAELVRFLGTLAYERISYKRTLKDTITTIKPRRPVEYEIGGDKVEVKVAQFYNHTFEVI